MGWEAGASSSREMVKACGSGQCLVTTLAAGVGDEAPAGRHLALYTNYSWAQNNDSGEMRRTDLMDGSLHCFMVMARNDLLAGAPFIESKPLFIGKHNFLWHYHIVDLLPVEIFPGNQDFAFRSYKYCYIIKTVSDRITWYVMLPYVTLYYKGHIGVSWRLAENMIGAFGSCHSLLQLLEWTYVTR